MSLTPGGKDTQNGAEGQIQSPLDGALAAGLTILVPVVMFAAVHWGLLNQAVHVWDLVLLSSGPTLLIACLQVQSASLV